MTMAYSYLRFSKKEQGRGDSIRRQTALRDACIARRGLTLDTSFVLSDQGLSAFRGKNKKTGALKLFLDAVADGRCRWGVRHGGPPGSGQERRRPLQPALRGQRYGKRSGRQLARVQVPPRQVHRHDEAPAPPVRGSPGLRGSVNVLKVASTDPALCR